jgi:DNA-directed RNA polymerase subunit RPC12/RpoP
MSKILLLDIEMAPNVAHVWGIWDQNIGLNQLRESSYVMCYAAKWLGDKKMMFDSVKKSTPKKMLEGIHKLLDESDAVIHYNGKRFDIPSLNKEFLLHKMFPPSPFKEIDLLTVAKGRFRFVSNKLDYVAQSLGLGKKTEHSGHELWVQCMAGVPKAWKLMEEYNKNDVILLEAVYERFKPWIKNHINLSMLSEDGLVCPNCGGKHYQKKGWRVTTAAKYQRYICQSCGTSFRDNKNVADKKKEKFITI